MICFLFFFNVTISPAICCISPITRQLFESCRFQMENDWERIGKHGNVSQTKKNCISQGARHLTQVSATTPWTNFCEEKCETRTSGSEKQMLGNLVMFQ